MSKLSKFIQSSKRILSISQKPGKKEFWLMSKIIGLGILVIGFIGFLIKIIINFMK